MMDGLHLFVEEPHPSNHRRRLDFKGFTTMRARATALPRYHFIDFGISQFQPPGAPKFLRTPFYGRDMTVPEFQTAEYVDPFKADLWSMGKFLEVFVVNVSGRPPRESRSRSMRRHTVASRSSVLWSRDFC